MRSKPRSESNNERIEEIWETLGLSKTQFSTAIRFMTEGGYDAALRSPGITDQLLLAAEGLLHRMKPNGELKTITLLVTITATGEISSRVLTNTGTIVLNGEEFLLVPTK